MVFQNIKINKFIDILCLREVPLRSFITFLAPEITQLKSFDRREAISSVSIFHREHKPHSSCHRLVNAILFHILGVETENTRKEYIIL